MSYFTQTLSTTQIDFDDQLPLAMIIEESPEIAHLIGLALRRAGFRTEYVSDGEYALLRLREVVPYLITLDLSLPNVDGTKVLKAIEADKRLANSKIIITAYSHIADWLRNRADLVLIKPIDLGQVEKLALRLWPRTRTNF